MADDTWNILTPYMGGPLRAPATGFGGPYYNPLSPLPSASGPVPAANPWHITSMGGDQKSFAWSPDNGTTVYILRPDHTMVRTGGTPAWRDNSPGNVGMATSAEIGSFQRPGVDDKPDRFAIFGSPAEANDSLYRQFFAPDSKFINRSVADAMKPYAPANENPTENYIRYIEQKTGLDRSTPLASMNEQQRQSFLDAVRGFEKTTPGDSVTSTYDLFGDD